jgi:hypothetical protein
MAVLSEFKKASPVPQELHTSIGNCVRPRFITQPRSSSQVSACAGSVMVRLTPKTAKAIAPACMIDFNPNIIVPVPANAPKPSHA